MPLVDQTAFRFAQFVVLPADKQLLRDGIPVPLTPKVFDTLLLLVEAQGRLVSKEEFFAKLWPDSYVEEVVLAHNVSRLRHALANGEGHSAPRLIETVPKRGYRFVEPVMRIEHVGPEGTPANTDQLEVTSVAPTQPTSSAPIATGDRATRRSRTPYVVLACGVVLIVAAALILLDGQASSAPHIVMTRQITHSGRVD